MTDFVDRTVFEENLDDVEAELHARVFQQAQVIERGAGKPLPSFPVHRGRGPHPLFRGTRFDFDKHQAILIPKDQIHLSPIRAEVGCEEL